MSPSEEASRLVEEAATRFRALGVELGLAYMEVTSGNVALQLGDLEKAARHYEATVELAEHLADDALRGRALSLLGLTVLIRGDVERARGLIVEGARANRRGGQSTSIAYSLDGLAAAALADGKPVVAARALASAANVRQQVGHPPAPVFFPMIGDLAARSRALLGDELYEAAVSEARQWDAVDALARALEGLE